MASPELIKQWKATATLLQRARDAVQYSSEEVVKLRKEFDEWLQHNELELALDTLQEISELTPCRGGFWKDLERAAEIMGLNDRAKYFHRRFLSAAPGA
jgi:hypothetical protein